LSLLLFESDYRSLEVTGDVLAERINEIDPEVKIFFISGYDEAVDAIKRLDVPVYGLFKKPVDPYLLGRLVRSGNYEQTVNEPTTHPTINIYSNLLKSMILSSHHRDGVKFPVRFHLV
jgi:two-component SAPR family response regulator